MENEDDVKYLITPKGFLVTKLINHGMKYEDIDNLWHMLEAFCLRQMKAEYPEAEYAALVFDGNGGIVVGLNMEIPL